MSGSVGQQVRRRQPRTRRASCGVRGVADGHARRTDRGRRRRVRAGRRRRMWRSTPYRLADTRRADCGCTRLDPATIAVRSAADPACPTDAVAVPVTDHGDQRPPSPGFVTLYPGGTPRPLVSVLNTRPDRPVANSAIIQLGANGTIELVRERPRRPHRRRHRSVRRRHSTRARGASSRRHTPAGRHARAGAVAGALPPGGELTVPLPDGCPADAAALAINVTSVGETTPGFLSARPAGTPLQVTSFLNMNGSGQAVAATTIMPVSASRRHALLARRRARRGRLPRLVHRAQRRRRRATDCSCRSGRSACSTPARRRPGHGRAARVELANAFPGAAALVTNVTATRSDRAGFVTAYPARHTTARHVDLNPAMFEHTVANMAITQLSDRGLALLLACRQRRGRRRHRHVHRHARARHGDLPAPPTRLLLAGAARRRLHARRREPALPPVAGARSSASRASSTPPRAGGCCGPRARAPSPCASPTPRSRRSSARPARIDVLVVKTGYNDWNSNFPAEFDAVVRAGRAKGAHTILWLSYTENQTLARSRAQAYQENNADLYRLVTLPQYSDVDARRLAGVHRRHRLLDMGRQPFDGGRVVAADRLRVALDRGHRAPAVPGAVGTGRADVQPVPTTRVDRPGAQRRHRSY